MSFKSFFFFSLSLSFVTGQLESGGVRKDATKEKGEASRGSPCVESAV
jgi:hypothetical protein